MSEEKVNIYGINKRLKELTKIQNGYVKQILEVNQQKNDYITEQISTLDTKKLERFEKIATRISDFQKQMQERKDGTISQLDEDLERIYRKVSRRIFYKKTELGEGMKFPSRERNRENWDGHNIAFGVNGIGYIEKYPSWSSKRAETRMCSIIGLQDILKCLKENPKIKSATCFKIPEKQEMFLKLYDIMMKYTYVIRDGKINLELKNPIGTVIESDTSYKDSDDDEDLGKGYGIDNQYIEAVKVVKIQLELSSYRCQLQSYIRQDSYSDEDKLCIDFRENGKHKPLNYYISQLPDSLLKQIEDYLDKTDKAIENNEMVLEEMRKEFGHILLVEAL